jgi:hypothetical protein
MPTGEARMKARVHSSIPWIASTLLVAACAGGVRQSRPDRNVISEQELQAAGSTDAYNVVQALRPLWLQKRGPSTITLQESVKVYLDGALLGGPEYLRQIDVLSVSTIRYMDALEATQRWGLDHGQGAIVVVSRRGSRR